MQVKKTLVFAGAAAVLALSLSTQASDLYWDTNDTNAGFDSGGTWGSDAFWTSDDTGGFAGGGVVATTSADVVRINQSNLASFTMDVTGSVHASRLVIPSSASPVATLNGAGTIHIHTSGLGDANAVVSGTNDLRLIMNPGLVLEAAGGSTVALGTGGGNNANLTFNGSITSTNSVDLLFDRPGALILNGVVDLKGGDFLSGSGGTFRPKLHTIAEGVLGSGVHDVYRSGVQGGHANDKGRLVLGANQAYTGDTFLEESRIRLLADTSLPVTTSLFITGDENDPQNALVELNFTGTNTIAGLHFNGSPQAAGTWGALGNGSTDFESGFFIGTGMLLIAPTQLPGDTNGDNDVDDSDLGTSFANYTGPLSHEQVPAPQSQEIGRAS